MSSFDIMRVAVVGCPQGPEVTIIFIKSPELMKACNFSPAGGHHQGSIMFKVTPTHRYNDWEFTYFFMWPSPGQTGVVESMFDTAAAGRGGAVWQFYQ